MSIRRFRASIFYGRRYSLPAAKQRGFTLMEVGMVAALLLILAAIGIPAFNGYVLENKVPKVAGELQRFVARTKANAEGGGPTPYAGINNVNNLAKMLRDSGIVSVDDTSGLVVHRLGGDGSGSSGVVTVAPAALGGGAVGNAFSLTLTDVSEKACPALASVMQQTAERISINGTVVKQLTSDNAAGSYNAVASEVNCTAGDSNEFVFTTR